MPGAFFAWDWDHWDYWDGVGRLLRLLGWGRVHGGRLGWRRMGPLGDWVGPWRCGRGMGAKRCRRRLGGASQWSQPSQWSQSGVAGVALRREAIRALWLSNAKSSGGLVVTGAISCGRICYNGFMKTVRVPISSDPEAQAQWEAVIKAFRVEDLRREQEAQARFAAERRRSIFTAVQGAEPGHERASSAIGRRGRAEWLRQDFPLLLFMRGHA